MDGLVGGSLDCRYVIVGGGNAAGYAARTFVEHGMADGRLCIVSKEVLSACSVSVDALCVLLCTNDLGPFLHCAMVLFVSHWCNAIYCKVLLTF